MSEPEPFLSRWSRRKREVEKEVEKDDAQDGATKSAPDEALARTQPAEIANAEKQISRKPGTPAFDPASLPPIEDIGVGTDIRAFLAQGVPAELKRAALRRVWVTDPAIRDFVGLAENDWDFTKPDTIPGFGELPADFDVADMVRRVFGDPAPEGAPQDQITAAAQGDGQIPAQADTEHLAQSEQTSLARPEDRNCQKDGQEDAQSSASFPVTGEDQEEEMVHRTSFAATQTKMTLSHHDEPKTRRQHGGALPQAGPKTNEDS